MCWGVVIGFSQCVFTLIENNSFQEVHLWLCVSGSWDVTVVGDSEKIWWGIYSFILRDKRTMDGMEILGFPVRQEYTARNIFWNNSDIPTIIKLTLVGELHRKFVTANSMHPAVAAWKRDWVTTHRKSNIFYIFCLNEYYDFKKTWPLDSNGRHYAKVPQRLFKDRG